MPDRPVRWTSRQRKAVLRGVYDENLRLREGYRSRPAQGKRQWWLGLRLPAVAGALLAALLVFYPVQERWTEDVTAGVSPAGAPDRVALAAVQHHGALPPAIAADRLEASEFSSYPPSEVVTALEILSLFSATEGPPTGGAAGELDLLAYAAPLTAADVPLKDLFGLEVKTIVLDAGHGGIDPGAIGPQGTLEKDITLDIARRLRTKLEKKGNYRVLMVRDGDITVPLNRRVAIANAFDTDLFVSIHINYLPNVAANAIETYYFGPHTDERTLLLAARENQGSQYSLSEFEIILRRMQDTIKLQESRALAGAIQQALYENLRERGQRVLDIGVRTAPFVVLLGVRAPSVLAEISSLSSPLIEEDLLTERYRDELASYLAEGISNYLNRRH
jgi:N-acetylmuramoyl-L-alanine amidase